ncbi:hypothetical protein IAU59_003168 [Kwoniella sp. CBS 9459]
MRLPRNSKLLCLLVFLSFIPPLILILGLLTYLDQSMRLCVPFSLQRISSTAHNSISCQAQALRRPFSSTTSTKYQAGVGLEGIMAEVQNHAEKLNGVNGNGNGNGEAQEGRLAGFLRSQKEAFLGDLRDGRGKGWTVVMGNEAGDLDSLASSVAFAQLSSSLLALRSIPLVLTPQKHMSLRPENLLALRLSHIPPSVFLHPENLPIPTTDLASRGVKFALVDHNRLLPPFGAGEVEAIIDHHDDEQTHLDASIREIQVPTGSCASLVAKHFAPEWKKSVSGPAGKAGGPIPAELATLLLSSILIDTTGLKPDRKATPTDYESASFLYPLSTLSEDSASLDASDQFTNFSAEGSDVPSVLKDLTVQLQETKGDVSGLSTSELLLRDYKEYALPTSSPDYPTLKVGLSTVPLGLRKWLAKEPSSWDSLLDEVDQYMVEKTLDIEGILTTFSSEKKGKHRRELALVVRSGGVIRSSEEAQKILTTLTEGLEASGETLGLAIWDKELPAGLEAQGALGLGKEGRWVNVWRQGNAKATRKQVAPLLRDLVAQLH